MSPRRVAAAAAPGLTVAGDSTWTGVRHAATTSRHQAREHQQNECQAEVTLKPDCALSRPGEWPSRPGGRDSPGQGSPLRGRERGVGHAEWERRKKRTPT